VIARVLGHRATSHRRDGDPWRWSAIGLAVLAVLLVVPMAAPASGQMGASSATTVEDGALSETPSEPTASPMSIEPESSVPAALPIPGDLWDTEIDVADGVSYVVLDGTEGDWVTSNGRYEYTKANSLLAATFDATSLSLTVHGDEMWELSGWGFPIELGYHTSGLIGWSGEGRSCQTTAHWVAIDELTRTAGAVSTITFRFEQRCGGNVLQARSVGSPPIRRFQLGR